MSNMTNHPVGFVMFTCAKNSRVHSMETLRRRYANIMQH